MKSYFIISGISLLFLLSQPVNAQEFPWPDLGDAMIIEPGAPGVINETINGDTSVSGERNHQHYILRRGQTYLYTASIANPGYSLMVTAEDGDGELPIVKALGPQEGQDEAERPFFAEGNLYLKDLTITGWDNGGNYSDNATIRLAVDGIEVVAKNINFDFNRQNAIRINAVDCKVYVENCIFGNQGVADRLFQGFALTFRGNWTEMVHMRNNTFYNLHSQVITNGNLKRYNTLIFEHNTVVNTGTGGMDFGRPNNLTVANNLFVNVGIMGDGFIGDRENFEVPHYYFYVDTNFTDTTNITILDPAYVNISNNHFYLDPSVAALLPDSSDRATETLFSPYTVTLLDEGTNVIHDEAFTFDNFPATTAMYEAYIDDFYNFADQPVAEMPLFDTDFRELDFGYSTDHYAYTSGIGGNPLGDLNWHDSSTFFFVKTPVFYCVGETPGPLEAEGTNLTWYSSQDGTGQSTPFTPSTEVAGHYTWYVTQTIDGEESIKIPIHVYVQQHTVTISDSVVVCGNTINFEAHTNYKGDGTEDIQWLGDFGEHSGKTFTLSPQQPGVLTVEAGTSTGCTASKTVSVAIIPAEASAEITNVSTNLTNKNQINWVWHNAEVIDSVFLLGKPDGSALDFDTLIRMEKSANNFYIDNREQNVQGQTLYTIMTKDVCGHYTNFVVPPGEHRGLQIHASSPDGKNWMVQWGDYKGRTVQQIMLLRGNSPENMLPIYTTTPNNNYLDISSFEDTTYYRVKVKFNDEFAETSENEAFSNLFIATPADRPFSDTVIIYDTIYITVTDTLVIDVAFVGIDNLTNAERVKIYPNPTNDFISIETTGISNPEKYTLKISSLSGNVVYISNLSSENKELNLADFGAGGLYFVELWDDKGTRIARRKIVLE